MNFSLQPSAFSLENAFLTSPWIPAEWIWAHGLTPRGIWAVEEFPRPAAPLTAGVCAFAETAVRFAAARPDSVVIFSTACDQMRRGFDALMLHGKPRASFLFNLPATWQSAVAKEIYRAELERLGQFLLSIGGQKPTLENLKQEILRAGDTRRRLLDSAIFSSARGFAQAVAQFHWDGSYLPSPAATRTANQVPLALVGGPLLATHWKLLDEIESAGGRIVLNATKTGERGLSPVFEFEAGGNTPLDTLVHGYCDHIVDVYQRPNTRLYSWLKPRLTTRQVRGIVLWHFTGCDLWRAELQNLRETFGLPVLLLEAGDEPGITARELTRLQAFVEMLKAEG